MVGLWGISIFTGLCFFGHILALVLFELILFGYVFVTFFGRAFRFGRLLFADPFSYLTLCDEVFLTLLCNVNLLTDMAPIAKRFLLNTRALRTLICLSLGIAIFDQLSTRA